MSKKVGQTARNKLKRFVLGSRMGKGITEYRAQKGEQAAPTIWNL